MAKKVFAFAFTVTTALAVLASASMAQPPAQAGPEIAELVKGNNAFAQDLYCQLSQEPGNIFFSPYSISTALAMTYGGARGQTAAEMANVLHFTKGQDTLHGVFGELIAGINGRNGPRNYELTTANRLWGQKDYTFDPSFLKLTQVNYGAGLEDVDFVKATEQARQTINAWVEEQTNQKIKDLIKPKDIDKSTRLVLTNAIYFKASWDSPFNEKATKQGEFKVSADKTVGDVSLMQKTFSSGARYYANDAIQLVALPYAKNELSMVIVLPRAIDGLPSLEKKLATTPGHLATLVSNLKPGGVKVTLPKFKVTSEFSLKKQLMAMGMELAFMKDKADFSGITTRDPLYIGAVIHKAFVDVHEKGTEAAAATAVIAGFGGAAKMQEPPDFRADHPFLYLIVDNKSGSILFMGRLVNPKAT